MPYSVGWTYEMCKFKCSLMSLSEVMFADATENDGITRSRPPRVDSIRGILALGKRHGRSIDIMKQDSGGQAIAASWRRRVDRTPRPLETGPC